MAERWTPRLLILDDDPSYGMILTRIAERSGWAPQATTDVVAFQKAFDAARPDGIVLDLRLGAGSGREQLRFLHDAGFEGGIVVMSGSDEQVLAAERDFGRSLGLAMTGLIAKPAENEEIRAQLVALAEFCAGRAGKSG